MRTRAELYEGLEVDHIEDGPEPFLRVGGRKPTAPERNWLKLQAGFGPRTASGAVPALFAHAAAGRGVQQHRFQWSNLKRFENFYLEATAR